MSIATETLQPILVVDDMAASLAFWTEKLGFTRVVTVPDQPPFDFAIVVDGNASIMLQGRRSVTDDLANGGAYGPGIVYVEVPAIEPVLARLEPVIIVVPRRTTFYGKDEVFVREPSGNLIGFAAPADVAKM